MNAVTMGLKLCRDAAAWGLGTYLHHFPLVFGLALIPTIQRYVLVYWGHSHPAAVNIAGEVITWAARIALVAAVAWLGIAREPRLRDLDWDARFTRMARYISSRPVAYAVQWAVLGVAFAAFGSLPPLVLDALVADGQRRQADAIVIAVKNPVVITFTFIWLVGTFRHMMLAGGRASPPLIEPVPEPR